jgi:hypothetical protein
VDWVEGIEHDRYRLMAKAAAVWLFTRRHDWTHAIGTVRAGHIRGAPATGANMFPHATR